MKKKSFDRYDWERVLNREDKELLITNDNLNCKIHLLKMIEVAEQLVDTKFGDNLIIADNYFSWMIYHENSDNYVVTALFDQNNKLIGVYIDVIDSIYIEDGHTYFNDLYIDVIVNNNGQVIIDDIDELEEALTDGDISKEQFDMAFVTGHRLAREIKMRPSKILDKACKYFEIINSSKGSAKFG